eukprot:PITA_07575
MIFNHSWEEHLQYIRQVLQTLKKHRLCANLEKCTFGMTLVQYLGYIIDEWGVNVDLAKIQVIWDWPTLTTLTEICNFLGLANFYCRHVDNGIITFWGRKGSSTQTTDLYSSYRCKGSCKIIAIRSGPLESSHQGRSEKKFFWSESQQKAFIELKYRLCSAPVLTLPDLKQPFEIKTDAYDYSIGPVLTQQGHPVAYHSDTLSDTVWKYPTYDKEKYSIVHAC